MASIKTNVAAFQAQTALKRTSADVTKTMERLSTGYKINRASDDSAGLAISVRMTSQIQGFQMAAQHSSDAIAMLQTAEGALTEITNLIHRMRELAVQGTTDTYSTSDRAALDTEYQQLESEITRIITDTKWNTIGLLDGTAGPSTTGTFKIQVGADSGMNISIALGTMQIATTTTNVLTDLNALAVSTQATAAHSVSKIDLALADMGVQRAKVGSYINRIQGALDNTLSMAQNLTDTRSRILDTDYALELAELARLQIIQQAGNAMLAQANAEPQQVLALLQ